MTHVHGEHRLVYTLSYNLQQQTYIEKGQDESCGEIFICITSRRWSYLFKTILKIWCGPTMSVSTYRLF